ncbi:protein-tyrosine phosphatase [Enterococcus sp. AZ194]
MENRFSVIETGTGIYELTIDSEVRESTKVYVTDEPVVLSANKRFLLETTEKQITIRENFNTRPYFIIENVRESYIIGTRNLPVEGMNNFRDMGGYEGKDGKHVKWGVLYRSDQPGNATEKGLDYLNSLGLQTIIDYRSSEEMAKYPSPIFPENTRTYHLDPNAHTAELSAQFQSSKEEEDVNLIASITEQQKKGALVDRYDIVMEQYHNFVTKGQSKQAFREMLKIIAQPGASAIDQHCRGGKDRTGFGAMLVLGLLGVSKADIIADYMLTYSNRLARNEAKMANYRNITQDESILNYLYSLIETRPEFIEASYERIIQEYETIEEYVKQELSVTPEEIAQIQAFYLE